MPAKTMLGDVYDFETHDELSLAWKASIKNVPYPAKVY
jgi:hypothetical protein